MDKMYMCVGCGYKQVTNQAVKQCPECDQKLFEEVKVYANSTMREESFIPGFGKANLVYSIEAIQDMKVAQVALKAYRASEPTEEEIELWSKLADRGAFGRIRTDDPTEEEIKDWQHYHEIFSKINFSEVKKRYNVRIMREEEPYANNEDYDWFYQ